MNRTVITECILTTLNLPGVGKVTAAKLLVSLNIKKPDTLAFRDSILYNPLANKRVKFGESDYDLANQLARNVIDDSEKQGVEILNFMETDYPNSLHELSDAPLVLYLKGNRSLIKQTETVAIVGTRNPTPHALHRGREIAEQAARKGMNIVSGLALGSDTVAHEAVVNAGGYTTAVLAHGLDTVYPKQNKKLAAQILNCSGLLVSEYPPGTPMKSYQLTERDRIQAGMANGLIVIETGVKGGTQHAIRHMKELGRPIACIFSHSEREKLIESVQGNRLLIEDEGATALVNDSDTEAFLETVMNSRLKDTETQGELNL
jgi:DNA processing protein